jgi:hypothetical protein
MLLQPAHNCHLALGRRAVCFGQAVPILTGDLVRFLSASDFGSFLVKVEGSKCRY